MKKILILMMSCNQPFFQEEEKICKETWLKDITKFDNIDYYIYTSSKDSKYYVDKKNHKLYVPGDDSLYGTCNKTISVFNLLRQTHLSDEYDYIFRTNLSTYINISLLNEFVNNYITDDNITYTSELYSRSDCLPYKYSLFPQGNGILLSKKLYDVLTYSNFFKYSKQYGISMTDCYHHRPDDGGIGFVLTSYYIEQKLDIFDMFVEFGFVRPDFLKEPDPYYDNILDFSKCIAISYRVFNQARTFAEESSRCKYIDENIDHDSKDLSFIKNWINKDMIHLYIKDLMDNIITKQEGLNLVKYNKDFMKIPYIKLKRYYNI